jgi:ABC-2 type transport system ATP-binding protein
VKDSQPVIKAQGLVKRFGDFTAVAGIDIDVQRGEIFGLLGPNGSGKTTTIRMLLGLLPATAGSIKILAESVADHPERIRPHIGYMSQRFSLYNDLTVMENLRFYARSYGLKNKILEDGIESALQMSGLLGREDARTSELSGGWRQRLALSAAVIHQPELLFLDEPTAGVDPVSRRAFWDLLYNLSADGTTVFVTTHYMDEAEHCHRLAFIQSGLIIASGSPASIKENVMRGEVLEIDCSNPAQAVKILRRAAENDNIALDEVALYGSMVHAVAADIGLLKKHIEQILQNSNLHTESMTIIAPSLEDVFIASMR